MFAIITNAPEHRNRRKITEQKLQSANLVKIGSKVSTRRLCKSMQKYNGDIIFTYGYKPKGLVPFDTSLFKATLLYLQFSMQVLSSSGREIKIGLIDREFSILNNSITTKLISHTASTIICTDCFIEHECQNWLLKTGICPEVTDRLSDLADCDFVFAPLERCAAKGIIFGQGGIGINNREINALIPTPYGQLLDLQVNPAELLCMLWHEGEVDFPHLENRLKLY